MANNDRTCRKPQIPTEEIDCKDGKVGADDVEALWFIYLGKKMLEMREDSVKEWTETMTRPCQCRWWWLLHHLVYTCDANIYLPPAKKSSRTINRNSEFSQKQHFHFIIIMIIYSGIEIYLDGDCCAKTFSTAF